MPDRGAGARGGQRRKRIAVVGTVVADTVHRDERVYRGLGGIAHTVAALAALSTASSTRFGAPEISPVCRVGADLWTRVRSAWADLPGIDLGGMIRHDGRNPRSVLVYGGAAVGDRSERLLDPVPALTEEEIESACAADLVLVNCITGEDCTTAAIERLRDSDAVVYLDLHGRALQRRPDGGRYYHRPPDALRWLRGVDFLQGNELEIATVAGVALESGSRGAAVEGFIDGLLGRSKPAGARRPGTVIVTAGPRGARVYHRAAGKLRADRWSAPAVEVVDPTGAGDAFGAGCAWTLLQRGDLMQAVRTGILVASAACGFQGVPPVEPLVARMRSL